ncbi:hypothetical protein PTKIN_Ptkin11bG0195500 [Pterospermum kingtungense]
MPNKSAQDVLVASEALHGESNKIPFLEYLLNDLNQNGREGEAYWDALDLAGIVPSPLEQFEIVPLIDLKIEDLYFSFTNPSLFMLLTLSLFLLLLYFVTKKGGGKLVPNAWQSLVELIYDFVLNPVNEKIGGLSSNVKQKYFPCISVTFTFSLFRNPQEERVYEVKEPLDRKKKEDKKKERSCRNKVQVYRSVRMPQLHTSLHFHLTPIVMINGSSRRDLLLNSQNFCHSIPAGTENPLPSRLCYQRL